MHIRTAIISRFLQADKAFVSGESIARELGLSRVSVWNHLEQLRADGYGLTAVRNRGYRLDAMPLPLHPDLLDALLAKQPVPYFKTVHCASTVASTNTTAEQLLAAGNPVPLVVLASEQTAGRGRRGRQWHSPPHCNLYLSIGLRPELPPTRLQTITLWLGLRVAWWLRDLTAMPIQVKWPNDLMLNNRKIAGILTEARVDAESTRELIVGIGLNINSAEADFPEEVRSIAGSLHSNGLKPQVLSVFAHGLLGCMAEALEDYFNDSYGEVIASQWQVVDYLAGKRVEAGEISGIVAGINSAGALRVRRDDGSVALLSSGEVSLHHTYANNTADD
jgi:BirA family biotin operon repressor/biotin-[acetyl-CoA-carboxylase] ligase